MTSCVDSWFQKNTGKDFNNKVILNQLILNGIVAEKLENLTGKI